MTDPTDPTDPRTVLPAPEGPSDPYARTADTFPTLTDEQVANVSAFGRVEDLPAGTVLFEIGDRGVDFFLVLDGQVEIYDVGPDGEPHVITVHARHQFTGELDLFHSRTIVVGGRMGVDGRVARLDRGQFRRMLAAEPQVADTVMLAFILRRAGFVSHGQAAVTVVGSAHDAATLRLRAFLSRNGYPFRSVDVDADDDADEPSALDLLAEHDVSAAELPVVLPGHGATLIRPSVAELAERLGISEPLDLDATSDVVVVGAGPAGLAAAVYAASEGLSTVVLEAEAPGGQAGTSSRIENYLGFPTGVSGQSLASRAQVQAQKFGATIAVPRRVEHLSGGTPYELRLDDGSVVRSRAVVIATGARYRRLDDVDGLARFEGSGVHYAATAMEAGLVLGGEVVVVGGGNSAGQAAVFLARSASHVHVLVRGDGLAATMSDYLIGRLEASADRITVRTRTEVAALHGDRHLEAVTWVDRRTGEQERRDVAGLFLMLGAVPNTEWLDGCVDLDDRGFVRTGTGGGLLETSRAGVFAVGDVRSGSVKRVASGVGEGSVVVSAVHEHLAALAADVGSPAARPV